MQVINRSLSAKLLLIVTGFVILSGILGAIRVGFAETQRIEARYDNRLQGLSTRYISYLQDELQKRANILAASRAVLLEDFSTFAMHTKGSVVDMAEYRDADGGYRLIQEYSGAFVPSFRQIDSEINKWVAVSGETWERLTPVVESTFNAFYFISHNNVSRVWPVSIVTGHQPEHDVTQEIFFSEAAPAQNPSRSAVWTPIYFDKYTQNWMTSMLYPVYIDSEFVGVLGGDINISYLLNKLNDLDADGNQIKAFIYDASGELVLHSGATPEMAREPVKSEQYQLLMPSQSGFEHYMQSVVNGDVLLGAIEPVVNQGEEISIVAQKFTDMEWFISFYYPRSLIDQSFRDSMSSVYTNIVVLALFLFVVLFFSIRRYVVRRIVALANATGRINQHNWEMSVPVQGCDEIARLGSSINDMLDQIRRLVHGLDDKIDLLDRASQESRRLMSAIENSASLVVILNRQWKIEYANSQYWQTSGYSIDSSESDFDPLLFDDEDSQKVSVEDIESKLESEILRGTFQEDSGKWQAEYLAVTAGGRKFWLMQTVTAILGAEQKPEFYVCVGQDISDLKEKQQEVEKLAYYDHLTGLANRTLFKSQLRATLNHSIRSGQRMALFYVDLDHFKRINDTFGHESGDHFLVEVARRLRGCLRQEDMVARLGGDEFAVLLNQVESPQYAYVVANKIIQALNRAFDIQGKEVVAGGSIGITLAPDDSDDIDVLMKNADLAMYQAKDKGRNAFQFYTADMNQAVEQRLTIERELRQALKFGQFELFYQPFVDFESGKIIGAEALIRWNHPVHGLVSPVEFISAAEESGLIVPLGKWVLKTACYQAKGIQKALGRKFRISVNLSARQLSESDFVKTLDGCLNETGLDPKTLELEVTESTLMEDAESVILKLREVRRRGCSLAIDDFGTGYSSLSYLKRLPITSLKVDRSFVKDLPDDEEDREITSLIVAMAKSLHYEVIVEGVETPEQHAFLANCGCHIGQGYFYSRPLPVDHFMTLLFSDGSESI
ncbi:EAL domain-containing protein [Gilvimarinus sp. SDUM040013]|uniref:EAL domain-containing protein n=1 Tax=Gilvimarinus gilvus TaxID=3058038 RepID=A0ABU4RVR3_9GAMM|nr:EAL domain-containing protein [Gilvimarinus sp. SDUM040013]MDO3384986.1 EAL domain-containing protein [Gilvimarinus sp. SDUM040013]MDX6848361.1 EAL domain-containing protein [Gilvimarinus sp. SDUM040013]